MKLILQSKWRWLTSILLITIIPMSSFIWSTASARTKRFSPGSVRTANTTASARTPNYIAGNFNFAAPLELPKSPLSSVFFQQDAEPEIKIDVFGNIYITAINGVPGGTDLWKSTDKGASFVYLGQPDGLQDKCSDPLLECAGLGGADDSIDVSTGGYLYISSLYIGNVTVSTSMDGGVGGTEPGQAWQVTPLGASVTAADDRQWLAAYGPETVYMTFRQAPGTGDLFAVKSTDAGKTFGAPVLVRTGNSTEGNLVVDPYSGNLYTTTIPSTAPNQINLLKSVDGGATWNETVIYTGPAGTVAGLKFTILAIDRGGNLHLVFSQGAGTATAPISPHVFLMSSIDQGTTWLDPVQVDNGPANVSAVMPWVVAGSPGVVNITWLGSTTTTPSSPAPPTPPQPTWQLFFAQTANALSATPTFQQVQVTTNPVHDKVICFNGSGCNTTPPNGTRDLLEYYTMSLDPEGNANIAYPNSTTSGDCDPSVCVTRTWFTRQLSGASAYNPPAGPAAATFGPNIPVGSPGGEPCMKADSHNCLFVTAPGNPWVWKSVNNGASFLPPVNPVADRVLSAGDEDILPIPQTNGARPDLLYFVDLATLTAINVAESTDGGATWFPPGPGGAAGEVDASVDRQWIAYDRNVPILGDLTVYEMDHEAASEAIRFNALTNDGAWSAPASGITSSEIILPPNTTFPNTNPGPVFVDPATHTVYGIFTASTIRTNRSNPPFGKLPNVWEAFGPPPVAAGAPPGPFIDIPVFKGVQDSPSSLPSPAPSPDPAATTYGNNTANDFPSAAIDAGGNIYVTWAMNNARTNEYMVWFAASHDHGQTFYGPFQVSQGPGAAVMPWIAAGDAGRIEIVFYATTTAVDPNIAPPEVEWHTMFAQSLNANSREPVFTVSPASHHVMHTGPICNEGILCGSGTRTLADFFQVAIGPDGLANIAYADNGPVPLPAGNPDTSTAGTHAEFARQLTGPLGLVSPAAQTCLATPSIQPVSAVSRKTHGGSGPFDVDLPLTGNPGIECRTGGANGNHTIIISFANAVTVGSASVASSDGNAMVSSFTVDGPLVTVNLTGVSNAQTITISLSNVSDGTNTGNVALSMGVLVGDTNADRAVNSGDISQTKSQSGHAVDGSNFREDLNVDGAIDSADISLVKSKSGTGF